jgi:hypothetical protein
MDFISSPPCVKANENHRSRQSELLSGSKGDRHRLCKAPFGPLRGKRSQSPLPKILAAPQLRGFPVRTTFGLLRLDLSNSVADRKPPW